MENNTLMHHGILGQKWGVRRFQNSDGSLTSAGRKRRGQNGDAQPSGKKEKKDKRRSKSSTENNTESVDRKKQRILKSRSAKELYDNADLFDTKELQEAYNRLALERNIKSLSPKEVSRGESFVNNTIKWTNKASDLINAGTKVYNSVNTVSKLFGDNTVEVPAKTKYKNKPVSKMTDKELSDAVTRMAREKNYNSLLKDLENANNPKRTITKNLIGDISELTDEQIKEINDRLDLEKRVVDKLSNR